MPERDVTLADWVKWKHKFTVLVLTLLTVVVVAMIAGFFAVQIVFSTKTDASDAKAEAAAAKANSASAIAEASLLRTTLINKNAHDIYSAKLREREDCLELVIRSNNGRAQHMANITAWATFGNKLKEAFPSQESQVFIDGAIAEVQADLKSAPLLSSEPLKEEECPRLPLPPEVIQTPETVIDLPIIKGTVDL